MLSIIIDSLTDTVAKTTEPSLYSETMSIAGKEVVLYWLEWARAHNIKTVNICSRHQALSEERIKDLYDLYAVQVVYGHPVNLENSTHLYYGIGLFLNDGSYAYVRNFDEFLTLQNKVLKEPLTYSAAIGYGSDVNIQIGNNVYIHPSVKLVGSVVIGDNCSIGKNVTIENSVINSDTQIKEGSVIKEAYIGNHVEMMTDLYLEKKALFPTRIYDIANKAHFVHEGLCAVHR